MTVQKCDKFCNQRGMSKVIYLACASMLTAGIIIEAILIHLIVMPYLAEETFVSSNCTYLKSYPDSTLKSCENKCSKGTSKFLCLAISVNYFDVNGTLQAGYLFDYYRTYKLYLNDHCSSSPCMSRKEDNRIWVIKFNQSLYDRHRFPCYYNNKQEVLLYKLNPFMLMLHSVIWPTSIFVISLIALLITWCIAGCRVWTQDNTVIA